MPPTQAQVLAQQAAIQAAAVAQQQASVAELAVVQAKVALAQALAAAPVPPIVNVAVPAVAPVAMTPHPGALGVAAQSIDSKITTVKLVNTTPEAQLAILETAAKDSIEVAKSAVEATEAVRKQAALFHAAQSDADKMQAFDEVQSVFTNMASQHGKHLSDAFSTAVALASLPVEGARKRPPASATTSMCSYCGKGAHSLHNCYVRLADQQRADDRGRPRDRDRRHRSRSPMRSRRY